MHSVTTWQAYNAYGGRSLYVGPGTVRVGETGAANRSRVVSFDRPYDQRGWGAPDFMGNEFPLVFLAERLGLDVTYITDIDLHHSPDALTRHRCLFSLGHDEYWSSTMRDGATAGPDPGGEPGVPGGQRRVPPHPSGALTAGSGPPPSVLQDRPRQRGPAVGDRPRRGHLQLARRPRPASRTGARGLAVRGRRGQGGHGRGRRRRVDLRRHGPEHGSTPRPCRRGGVRPSRTGSHRTRQRDHPGPLARRQPRSGRRLGHDLLHRAPAVAACSPPDRRCSCAGCRTRP